MHIPYQFSNGQRSSFATCADGNNFVRAMTMLRKHVKGTLKTRPKLIVINGDGPGSGKTALKRRILGALPSGVRSLMTDGTMALSAMNLAVRQGQPLLFMEGLKTNRLIEVSNDLCSFVTSEKWRIEKLSRGRARMIEKPQNVAVIVIGDHLKLTPDLERRAIVINLCTPVVTAAPSASPTAAANDGARDLEPDLEEICTLAAVYQQQKDRGIRTPHLRRALISACEALQPDLPF